MLMKHRAAGIAERAFRTVGDGHGKAQAEVLALLDGRIRFRGVIHVVLSAGFHYVRRPEIVGRGGPCGGFGQGVAQVLPLDQVGTPEHLDMASGAVRGASLGRIGVIHPVPGADDRRVRRVLRPDGVHVTPLRRQRPCGSQQQACQDQALKQTGNKIHDGFRFWQS